MWEHTTDRLAMDLFDAYDHNNVFAKILRGEAPAIVVHEDEQTLSFMDIMPQVPGHVLVIPKYPATNLLALPDAFAEAVMRTTRKMAAAVQRALEAPGIMIVQLNGAQAGQTVFHYHMHVIPRHAGIDMKFHARELVALDKLTPIAERIRAQIQSVE